MDTTLLDKHYFYRDLTAVGKPNTAISGIINDKQVQAFNSKRYNFYSQLLRGLTNPESKQLVEDVLALESSNRVRRDNVNTMSTDVAGSLASLYRTDKHAFDTAIANINRSLQNNPVLEQKLSLNIPKREGAQSGGGDEEKQPMAASSPLALLRNVFPKKAKLEDTPGSGEAKPSFKDRSTSLYKRLFIGPNENAKDVKPEANKAGETEPTPEGKKVDKTFFAEKVAELEKQKDNPVAQLEIINEYKNHAFLAPEKEQITMTDRTVFIAMTYVLRGLSMFVVQWALNSYMVKNFDQAFMLYIVTYLGLFLLWTFLTNAAGDIYLFRMLFYYVSVTPHGYGRIIVHVLLQLLLLPIPSIINNKKQQVPYSFEESRRIYAAISRFTMLMWLLGVLVAVKY